MDGRPGKKQVGPGIKYIMIMIHVKTQPPLFLVKSNGFFKGSVGSFPKISHPALAAVAGGADVAGGLRAEATEVPRNAMGGLNCSGEW